MSAKMNAKETIREMLKGIYDVADVNAMQIWKGFDISTGRTGWHIQWFGTSGAEYIGATIDEVAEFVDEVAELRESA